MNSLTLLLLLFVGAHALVERKVPIKNDNTVLAKILQSVDAANSHQHLYDVTLKLLKSLCVCMRETLREKEESILFNDGSNSLQFDNHVHSRDVFGLYRRIYNNTCFNLQQELAGKLNSTRNTLLGDNNDEAILEQTNCGKRIADEIESAINSPKEHLKEEIKSKLQHILYKTLIDTKDFHKYRITRRSLLGKAKTHAKSSLGHSIIVILTLHPKFSLNKTVPDSETIKENELNDTLYSKSIVDIDIIDAKYDVLGKESEELTNNDLVLDCHLQSVYTFLIECEKNNMTKVFRLLRKTGTIKMYIEVTTLRNHTDYSSICCDNDKTIAPCRKIRRFRSEDSVEIKKLPAQAMSTKKQKEYKDTLIKIQNWVKLYEQKSGPDNITSVRFHIIDKLKHCNGNECVHQNQTPSTTELVPNKNSLITPTNLNKKEKVTNYLNLKTVRENFPSKLITYSIPLEDFDKTDNSLNTLSHKSAKSVAKSTSYDTNNVHQMSKLELKPLKYLVEEKAASSVIIPTIAITNTKKTSNQLYTESDKSDTESTEKEPLTSYTYTALPTIRITTEIRNVHDTTTGHNVLIRGTVPNVTPVRPRKATSSMYDKDYHTIGKVRSKISTDDSALYKNTDFKKMVTDFTTSDLKVNAEKTSVIMPANTQTKNVFTTDTDSKYNWLQHKATTHPAIHNNTRPGQNTLENNTSSDYLYFSFGDSSHLQPLARTKNLEQYINHFTSDGILKTNLMRQNPSKYGMLSRKNKGKSTEYISTQEPESSSDDLSTTNVDRSSTRSNVIPTKIITKVYSTTPGVDGVASAIQIMHTNVKTSVDNTDISFTKNKNSKFKINTVPYKDTTEKIVTDKLDRMIKIFQRTTEKSIATNRTKAKLSTEFNKLETNNTPADEYFKTTTNNLRQISKKAYITKGYNAYRRKGLNSSTTREHLPSMKYPLTVIELEDYQETTPIHNTIFTSKINKDHISSSATNEESMPFTLDNSRVFQWYRPLEDSTVLYQEIINNDSTVILPSEARSNKHDSGEKKTSNVLDITPSTNILELNNTSTEANSESKLELVNSMRNQYQMTGQLKLLNSKRNARRESTKKKRQRQIIKEPNYNTPNIYLNDETSTVIIQSDVHSKKNNVDKLASPTVFPNSINDYVILPTYDDRRDSTQVGLNFGKTVSPGETTSTLLPETQQSSLIVTVKGVSKNNVSHVIHEENYNLRQQNSSPFVRYITATSASTEVNDTYLISEPQTIEEPRALSMTVKLLKSATDDKNIFFNEAHSGKSKPASTNILNTNATTLIMTTENNPHSKYFTVNYNDNDYKEGTETSDIKYTENDDQYDTNNNNDAATLTITDVMKPEIRSTKQNSQRFTKTTDSFDFKYVAPNNTNKSRFQQPKSNNYNTLSEFTINWKQTNISQTKNIMQTTEIIESNSAGFTKKVSKNDVHDRHNKIGKIEKTDNIRDIKKKSKQLKNRAKANATSGDIRKIFGIPVPETLIRSSSKNENRITRQINSSRLITHPTYSSYNSDSHFRKSSKIATTTRHEPDLVTSSTYKLTAEAPKFHALQISTENPINSRREDNVTNISTTAAGYFDTTGHPSLTSPKSILTASEQNQPKFEYKEEINSKPYSRNSSFRGSTKGMFLKTLQTVANSEAEHYHGQWSTTNEARRPQSSNYSKKMTVMSDDEINHDSKPYNQHLEKNTSTSQRSVGIGGDQGNHSETFSKRRDTYSKVTTEITKKELFEKVANSAKRASRPYELTTLKFTPSSNEKAIDTLDHDGNNYLPFTDSLSGVLTDTTKKFKLISINIDDEKILRTERSTGSLNVNNLHSGLITPKISLLETEDYETNLKSNITSIVPDFRGKPINYRDIQSPSLQEYETFKSYTTTRNRNSSNTDDSSNSSPKAINLLIEKRTTEIHTSKDKNNSETNKSTNETIKKIIGTTRKYSKNIDNNLYQTTKQEDVIKTHKPSTTEVIEKNTKKFLINFDDQHSRSTKKFVYYQNSRKHFNPSKNESVYSAVGPASINKDSIKMYTPSGERTYFTELKDTTLLSRELVLNNTISRSTQEYISTDIEYSKELLKDTAKGHYDKTENVNQNIDVKTLFTSTDLKNTATTDNVQKVQITTPSYDVYKFIETTPVSPSSTGFSQKRASQNEVRNGTSDTFTTNVEQNWTTDDYQPNDIFKTPKYEYIFNQTAEETSHDPTKSNYGPQMTSTEKNKSILKTVAHSPIESDFSTTKLSNDLSTDIPITAIFSSVRTESLIEPYTVTGIPTVTESFTTMSGMDTMKLNSEMQNDFLGNNENGTPYNALLKNNNGQYESGSYPEETNSEITQIMDLDIQKINTNYTKSRVENKIADVVTNSNTDDNKDPKAKIFSTTDATFTEIKETHFGNNSVPNSTLAAKNISLKTSSSEKYNQILERNQEISTTCTFPMKITPGLEELNTASILSGIQHAPMESAKILLNFGSKNDIDEVTEVYTDSSKGSAATDKKTDTSTERNSESLPHTVINVHEKTQTEENNQILKTVVQAPISADVIRINEKLSTLAFGEHKNNLNKYKVANGIIETVLIVNDAIPKNKDFEITEANSIENIIPVTIIESSFENQFTTPLNKLYDVEEMTQKTLSTPDFLTQIGTTLENPYISSEAPVFRTISTKDGTDARNHRRQKYDHTISENSPETPNDNGYGGKNTKIATYQISTKENHTSRPLNTIEIHEESTSSEMSERFEQTPAQTDIDTNNETTLENVYTGNNISSIANTESLVETHQISTEKQVYGTLLTSDSKSRSMTDIVYNNKTTALTNKPGDAYDITVKGPFTVETYNTSINSETDKTSEFSYRSKYYDTSDTIKNYTISPKHNLPLNNTKNKSKYQNYSSETKKAQKTVAQTPKESDIEIISKTVDNVAGNTVVDAKNDKPILETFMNSGYSYIENQQFETQNGSNSLTATYYIYDDQITKPSNHVNESNQEDSQIEILSQKESHSGTEITQSFSKQNYIDNTAEYTHSNINNTYEIVSTWAYIASENYSREGSKHESMITEANRVLNTTSKISINTVAELSLEKLYTKFHTSDDHVTDNKAYDTQTDSDAIIMTEESILENPVDTTTGPLFDINTRSVTINNDTYKIEITKRINKKYTDFKIIPDLLQEKKSKQTTTDTNTADSDIFTTLTDTHEQVTTNTLKHLTDNSSKATIEKHNETFDYISPFKYTSASNIPDTGTSKSNLSKSEKRKLFLVTTIPPKGGTMEYYLRTTDLKDNSTPMEDGVNGNQTTSKEKFEFYKTYKPAQSTAILSMPQEINSNKSLRENEKSDNRTSAVTELKKINHHAVKSNNANAEHYIYQSSNNYTTYKVSENYLTVSNTSLKNTTLGESDQQRLNTGEDFERPLKSDNLPQTKIEKEDEIEKKSTIFEDEFEHTYSNRNNHDKTITGFQIKTAFTTPKYLDKNRTFKTTNIIENSSKTETDNVHINNITQLIDINLKVSKIVQEPVSPIKIFSKVQTKKYVTEISDKPNDKKSTDIMTNYNALKSKTATTHTNNNAFTTAKNQHKLNLLKYYKNLPNKNPITKSPIVKTTKRIRKIIYNTYKPNTDEEFDYLLDNLKVSEYKSARKQQTPKPPVKNTCSTLRKLSHDLIRNVQEIKKLLKANNCSQAPVSTVEGRNVHPKLTVKNIWKQPSNKENLLHPFAKTNLFPVKEISFNRHKLMREVPVRKELMKMNTQDFYARRMVTPKNKAKDLKKYPKSIMYRRPSGPLPRHQILRPNFETIKPVVGEYFRPKPLFIQRDDEYYTDGFRYEQHPVGLTWKEKVDVIQNAINTQTKVNRDSIIDEALERPALKHPVATRPKYLRDRVDSIHNYLYKADFVRPSRRPATSGILFLDSSEETVERITPPVFQYRRRKATYVNIEPKTTTKRPKRKGRTLFFLSPTVPYNYF